MPLHEADIRPGPIWFEAPTAPANFEGEQVWQFSLACSDDGVTIEVVTPGYSREPRHCGGIWWTRLYRPAPPTNTQR